MATILKKSPLAPEGFPDIPPIAGLRFATAEAGERYQARLDLMLAVVDQQATVAGVFTRSNTPGAPVSWSKTVLATGQGRALVVNAGNANVCSGLEGQQNTQKMAAAAAAQCDCDVGEVFVCSTGVIGEQLKVQKVLDAMPGEADLSESNDWLDMAKAIMTTDTYAKGATEQCEIAGEVVTLAGVAKGSGMIEPNMATMLTYLYTDAKIASDCLQSLLTQAVQQSFNCITVDSDTSTSDTCLLFATGRAAHAQITDANDPALDGFKLALLKLSQNLAQQVVRDGEGASKFITVEVSGAESDRSAQIVAKSIANSPLVKTAISGEDANWGRIVMAVGKTQQPLQFERLSVSMGGVKIAEGDGPLQDYDEALVTAHLQGQDIHIAVNLGLDSPGVATVWACDLTHAYIDINADYRS